MDIIGYTYQAEIYCPACVIERGISGGFLAPGARDMSAEDALDQAAHYVGVNRHDERSYDSDEFPKAVFSFDAMADETCGNCGGEL